MVLLKIIILPWILHRLLCLPNAARTGLRAACRFVHLRSTVRTACHRYNLAGAKRRCSIRTRVTTHQQRIHVAPHTGHSEAERHHHGVAMHLLLLLLQHRHHLLVLVLMMMHLRLLMMMVHGAGQRRWSSAHHSGRIERIEHAGKRVRKHVGHHRVHLAHGSHMMSATRNEIIILSSECVVALATVRPNQFILWWSSNRCDLCVCYA